MESTKESCSSIKANSRKRARALSGSAGGRGAALYTENILRQSIARARGRDYISDYRADFPGGTHVSEPVNSSDKVENAYFTGFSAVLRNRVRVL